MMRFRASDLRCCDTHTHDASFLLIGTTNTSVSRWSITVKKGDEIAHGKNNPPPGNPQTHKGGKRLLVQVVGGGKDKQKTDAPDIKKRIMNRPSNIQVFIIKKQVQHLN